MRHEGLAADLAVQTHKHREETVKSKLFNILAILGLILGTLYVPAIAAPAQGHGRPPRAEKVIFFASDGMRPDHVDKYVAEGVMPTFADLLAKGVKGDNGLLQGFPPNTGVGWATLKTGTWPGEHGSTNNTFFRQGESSFNSRTGFADSGIVQADHIAQAA